MQISEEIANQWLAEAKRRDATHLLIVCDTFKGDEYPVYVGSNENFRDVWRHYHNRNMQKVTRTFDLESISIAPTQPVSTRGNETSLDSHQIGLALFNDKTPRCVYDVDGNVVSKT